MSNSLINLVPVLDGTNYQVWSRSMKAYLRSQDLWLYTNGTWMRPGFAGAAHPTAEECTARANWDKNNESAIGYMTLHLNHTIWDKMSALTTAANIWTRLETDYGTISPTVVFEFYKKTTTFKVDPKRQPRPQIEYLEGLYTHLEAETVDIPDFVQAMTLLTALPHSWEPPIIQAALASGQITQVTLANTKSIILCYWEAERAKKGATSHVANKISAVK